MERFVELIEERLGWGWAILAAIVVILIPIGFLFLVATGVIDAGLFG